MIRATISHCSYTTIPLLLLTGLSSASFARFLNPNPVSTPPSGFDVAAPLDGTDVAPKVKPPVLLVDADPKMAAIEQETN